MTENEGMRLSAAMNQVINDLKIATGQAAERERDYRKLKALKYAEAADMAGLAAAKTAWVDAETADARYDRDLADGMRSALMEEVRNLRQQLSFTQTTTNATIEDMKFHGTGQAQ